MMHITFAHVPQVLKSVPTTVEHARAPVVSGITRVVWFQLVPTGVVSGTHGVQCPLQTLQRVREGHAARVSVRRASPAFSCAMIPAAATRESVRVLLPCRNESWVFWLVWFPWRAGGGQRDGGGGERTGAGSSEQSGRSGRGAYGRGGALPAA
jgi:uncharacterized membrane protein YgcG